MESDKRFRLLHAPSPRQGGWAYILTQKNDLPRKQRLFRAQLLRVTVPGGNLRTDTQFRAQQKQWPRRGAGAGLVTSLVTPVVQRASHPLASQERGQKF